MSSTGTRSGPVTPMSPTGVWCWPGRTRMPNATAAFRHSSCSMHQPGIEQRPLQMISGVTKEFGQVSFDGAKVPVENMVGAPGEGWPLAMTVVGHEREPSTLGFAARYGKTRARSWPNAVDGAPSRGTGLGGGRDGDVDPPRAAAAVGATRRTSRTARNGSIDKLLMTWAEQAVGHAVLGVAAPSDTELLGAYCTAARRASWAARRRSRRTSSPSRILGLGV